jgi:hypothetical protein
MSAYRKHTVARIIHKDGEVEHLINGNCCEDAKEFYLILEKIGKLRRYRKEVDLIKLSLSFPIFQFLYENYNIQYYEDGNSRYKCECEFKHYLNNKFEIIMEKIIIKKPYIKHKEFSDSCSSTSEDQSEGGCDSESDEI